MIILVIALAVALILRQTTFQQGPQFSPSPSPSSSPSVWCECDYNYAKDGGIGGDSFTLNTLRFPVPTSGQCEDYNQDSYTSLNPPNEFPKAKITNCRKVGRF